MATQTITLPTQLRGGGAPVVVQTPFGPNAWQHINLQINSPAWLVTNDLRLGYSARVSINGGATWTDWGGLQTGPSQETVNRQGVRVNINQPWPWDPAFAGGGTLEITITCPTAFVWGATITLLDT